MYQRLYFMQKVSLFYRSKLYSEIYHKFWENFDSSWIFLKYCNPQSTSDVCKIWKHNTVFFMTNSSSIYWLKSQQTVFVMFNRKAKSGRVSLGAIFPSQRHVQPDVACWELPCPRRGAPALQEGHGEFTVWSDIFTCLKQIKSPEIQ